MQFPLEGLIAGGLKIIDKVIPDPAARDAAKLELLKAQQSGELDEMRLELAPVLAVHETNKIEAANGSIFVAGWRPAVGWVCAGAVAWHFVASDLMLFVFNAVGIDMPALPALDIQELLGLLMAMLGVGSMRTVEKLKGVAAK